MNLDKAILNRRRKVRENRLVHKEIEPSPDQLTFPSWKIYAEKQAWDEIKKRALESYD